MQNQIKEGNNGVRFEELDVKKILLLLWHGKWLLIGLTLLGFAAASLYLRYTIPLYQAKSVVNIDIGVDKGLSDIASDPGTKDASGHIEVMRSYEIIQKLVHELKLQVSYFAQGRVVRTSLYEPRPFNVWYDSLRFRHYDIIFEIEFSDETNFRLTSGQNRSFSVECQVGKPCIYDSSRIQINLLSAPQIGLRYEFIVHSMQNICNKILSKLSINPYNGSSTLVEVQYTDDIPHRASQIINKLSRLYLQDELVFKRRSIDQQIAFIDSVINEVEKKKQFSEKDLANFEHKYQMPAFTTLKGVELSKLGSYEMERENLELEQKELYAVENYIRKVLSNPKDTSIIFAPNLSHVQDANLTALVASLQVSLTRRAVLLQTFTNRNPQVQRINREIEDNINRIYEAIANFKQSIENRKKLLTQRKGEISGKTAGFPQIERNFSAVDREFQTNEKKYFEMLDRRIDMQISKAAIVSRSRIINEAYPPSTPISPKNNQILFSSILAGFITALCWIILKELNRNTFADRQELEQRSNIPIIAEVVQQSSRMGAESRILPVLSNSRSAITESFRTLRANLQFIASDKDSKLLVTTSTISGEGKSFISMNLAGVISLLNRKTILVDLDLRKPRMHTFFNLPGDAGVSTYMIGQDRLDDVIMHTGYQNLDLLPAGPTPPNPAELLSVPGFKVLIEELRKRYEYILVDTSPVGLVTDCIPVMQMADAVLYVVRADYSKRGFINAAERLEIDYHIKNTYLVFNCIASRNQSYGYYYTGSGYGYYGGYYYDDKTQPKWFEFWKKRKQLKKGSSKKLT